LQSYLKLYNQNELQGYLSPVSHEIVQKPTLLPGKQRNFYFVPGPGEEVILLNTRTVVTGIEVLPQPFEEMKKPQFPSIGFKAKGVYGTDIIANVYDKAYSMAKSVGESVRVDVAIAAFQEGKATENEETLLEVFENISWRRALHYVKIALLVVVSPFLFLGKLIYLVVT